MAKFFSFLFFVALVGGIIWYENRPTTVAIPVETNSIDYQNDYYEEPTTTMTEVTQPQQSNIDYSSPDLTLKVEGVNGDNINLVEVIGKPKHLSELSEEVRSVVMSCPGVTDRDMVIKVDAQLELLSSLPAKVNVDYRTTSHASVYDFSNGMQCDDGGGVSHKLTPDKKSHIAYWVVLSGVVTPDHPDGDFQNLSVAITAPVLTLPNFGKMFYKFWGPRVVSCDSILGNNAKVWLAGKMPEDCTLADTEALATGNK